MLSPAKRRIILICSVGILIWLLFRYSIGDGLMLTVESVTRIPGTPILVTVFYEALCPDSKHFITKQLVPAYKAAPSVLEVVLVPYGKASTSISSDGSLNFDCQHGPLECQANMYHACTIEIITDPIKRLDMVTCMIKDNRLPKEALYRCARDYNLETANSIQKCYDTNHGSELLKMNGDATHALRPAVSFIPTITIDGAQGKQAAILKNLMGEVCKVASGDSLVKDICTND
ncbi:GILT-like protein 1 [Eupeodes corollae]|uniref:GILT-like protein 1 n=1 Tax=Eupeodes corollae TaxID=290404 RepID=UPI002492641D|nr:GILT-like protein 1 [Eupeodes corollae]